MLLGLELDQYPVLSCKWLKTRHPLEVVQILDSGLHEANFISCFVKIFAVLPTYGCKFCLA